jgi:hypothetical protein
MTDRVHIEITLQTGGVTVTIDPPCADPDWSSTEVLRLKDENEGLKAKLKDADRALATCDDVRVELERRKAIQSTRDVEIHRSRWWCTASQRRLYASSAA